MGVDHNFMKGTLIKNNNVLAGTCEGPDATRSGVLTESHVCPGDAVHSLVNKQKEAKSTRKKKIEEKKRREQEQQAQEQKQRIQAKLEEKCVGV